MLSANVIGESRVRGAARRPTPATSRRSRPCRRGDALAVGLGGGRRAPVGSRRGRCRAAARHPAGSGSARRATMPHSAAATSTVEKNGVLPSSTPTCGGLAGSRRARNAAARSAAVLNVVAPARQTSRRRRGCRDRRPRPAAPAGSVTVGSPLTGPAQAGVSASSRPISRSCAVAPPSANSTCLAVMK